jgi:protein-S-isoprenylcysteine O-methyltransferase Ste14
MKYILRAVLGSVIVGGVVLALGNHRDPWLWTYVAAFMAVAVFAISRMDDDLVQERFSPPSPGADRVSLRTVRLVALGHIAVGVLDSRYAWTHVAAPWRALGILGFVLCFLAIAHAARTNRFFSSVVRIQTDRGHRVVDRGLYAAIRHPGYAAMLPVMQFSALALGSWYAFAAAFVYSALILRRLLFEDRYLRENLEGYAAYTRRVPYRLVPHVW